MRTNGRPGVRTPAQANPEAGNSRQSAGRQLTASRYLNCRHAAAPRRFRAWRSTVTRPPGRRSRSRPSRSLAGPTARRLALARSFYEREELDIEFSSKVSTEPYTPKGGHVATSSTPPHHHRITVTVSPRGDAIYRDILPSMSLVGAPEPALGGAWRCGVRRSLDLDVLCSVAYI